MKNTEITPQNTSTWVAHAYSVNFFNGTSSFGRAWDAAQTLGVPLGKKKLSGLEWENG